MRRQRQIRFRRYYDLDSNLRCLVRIFISLLSVKIIDLSMAILAHAHWIHVVVSKCTSFLLICFLFLNQVTVIRCAYIIFVIEL